MELSPEGNRKPGGQVHQIRVLKDCCDYSRAMDPDRLDAKQLVRRLLQQSRQKMLQHQLTGQDQNWREEDICQRQLGGKNERGLVLSIMMERRGLELWKEKRTKGHMILEWHNNLTQKLPLIAHINHLLGIDLIYFWCHKLLLLTWLQCDINVTKVLDPDLFPPTVRRKCLRYQPTLWKNYLKSDPHFINHGL